jgi:hypothetical protein
MWALKGEQAMRITIMKLVQLATFLAIVAILVTRAPATPIAAPAMSKAAFDGSLSSMTGSEPLRYQRSTVGALPLSGRWYWRVLCPGGRYQGAAYLFQRGPNRFSGQLGNTSIYDRGTISGGVVHGRRASFTLTAFGQSVHLGAVIQVTGRGGLEARASYVSRRYGNCLMRFYKG